MAELPDEGFRVTDRRRRDTIEAPGASSAPSPPRPAATFSPEVLHDAPDPRNLVGLFVMLATEAVIALGEAPDPVTGQRQRELPHAAGLIDLLFFFFKKTAATRSSAVTQSLAVLI